ncbi:hypothetical protein E2320_001280 [Naja naja]|nr:hypothetical protein E2320_001280 [Naja naja]
MYRPYRCIDYVPRWNVKLFLVSHLPPLLTAHVFCNTKGQPERKDWFLQFNHKEALSQSKYFPTSCLSATGATSAKR